VDKIEGLKFIEGLFCLFE